MATEVDLEAYTDLEAVRAELQARSLREFVYPRSRPPHQPGIVNGAWDIIEPGTPFRPSRYIDAICEHLQAVTEGQLRSLVISMPPGHAKSILVAVLWFCWHWQRRPFDRFLYGSYNQLLSTRDSRKARDIIEHPWYEDRFGANSGLPPERQVVLDREHKRMETRFENTNKGYRIATAVKGIGTGERCDLLVADDPHNVRDVESELRRTEAVRWWFETMRSRLNDPQGPRVIVAQRTHNADCLGEALSRELGYEHLNLPNEYGVGCPVRVEHKCSSQAGTSLGFVDWRTEEGEILGLMTVEDADQLRLELGDYAYEAQYNQAPSLRAGGLFRTAMLAILPVLPYRDDQIVWIRAYDKAGTIEGGKFTAGVRIGRMPDGRFVIAHVWRDRLEVHEREARIKAQAIADGPATKVWLEQEPGSGGKDSALMTIRNLAGFAVTAEPVSGQGSKEERARPFASQVNVGNVVLLQGEWNEAFVAELQQFPGGSYQDQVDAVSGGFNLLQRRGTMGAVV